MQENMLVDYVDEVSFESSDLHKSKYVKEIQQWNEIIKPNTTTQITSNEVKKCGCVGRFVYFSKYKTTYISIKIVD